MIALPIVGCILFGTAATLAIIEAQKNPEQAQSQLQTIQAEAPPKPITTKPAPPNNEHHGKLVVERLQASDGQVVYCIHWEPCERCEFHCVK